MKSPAHWRIGVSYCSIALLGIACLFIACSTPGTTGDTTDDDTTPGESLSDDFRATIPDAGLTILEIEEDGDNGSVKYYADQDVSNEDAELAGFEAETEDGFMTAASDADGNPSSVSLGSLLITFSYNDDGTMNYELTKDGELLYSGSNLSIDESLLRTRSFTPKGYTSWQLNECVDGVISKLYNQTGFVHGAIECFERDPDLFVLNKMICVLGEVLLPRLNLSWQVCDPQCEGLILEQECREACYAKMDRAFYRLQPYVLALTSTAVDAAEQIAQHLETTGRCPGDPEETDDTDTNAALSDCDMSEYLEVELLEASIVDGVNWGCEQRVSLTNTHDSDMMIVKRYVAEASSLAVDADAWELFYVTLEPGETKLESLAEIVIYSSSTTERRLHYSKYVAVRDWDCANAITGPGNPYATGNLDEDTLADLGVFQVYFPDDACHANEPTN